ncbi:NlpC/P60 family protein [Lactobacillus taiwanensis]|uniref:C40 family peptidase n=1 Tax=Lactobacillus taiwanensis TaxID=508451 RepID=UPI00214C8E9A|nr:C40 family peptidase [Lactobacillus taiwanensis]MCR1903246.1 NlpC/P60 family protein [Lactobacillus taiwanensis]
MTIKSKVIKFTTAASFAVAGIATLSAAKLNALSFNNTAQASTVQAPAQEIGVVKVNSKTGESVAVWNSYEDNKQQTGKYLPHESTWKTYKKVKNVKGETWYNLGGDQWISADDVQEEAPIAVTADLTAVKAAVSQVPAANVANNAQNTTAQTAVANVNNAQVATAPVQTNTAAKVQSTSATAQAPVAQAAAATTVQTNTASANVAPAAKTNYVQTNTAAKVQSTSATAQAPVAQAAAKTTVQTNTAVKAQQAATTYSAPAQNTTTAAKPQAQTAQPAAKPAQQQAASSQAPAQTAKPQASTQSNSSVAQTVVSAAQSQVGKPYVWGATGPNAYDCSGLVQYAYSQAGKNVGRTTYQQAGAGQHVSVSQAQAGDILMWGDYHDAIYVGNNQYVHAPQPGQNVTQATISSYFMPDYAIRVN